MGALCPSSLGQSDAERVERMLDQPIRRIQIVNQPFKKALEELEDHTKLKFKIEDDVLDLMPYGEDTRISFIMHDMSTREALKQAFDGLGLAITLDDGKVRIKPGPILERLQRKLTLQETALLERLAGGPWDEIVRVKEVKVEFRADPASKPQEQFERAIRQFRGPALRQLDETARLLGWTWTPEGDTIVFSSRREDIQRRLDRPLELKFQRTRLDDVFMELSQRAGIAIEFAPGALQRVNARERIVDLVQRRTTARALLERLCGLTGLSYEVTDNSVRISCAGAAPGPVEPPAVANPAPPVNPPQDGRREIIGYVIVYMDGRPVQVPIYEGDLPEAAEQALKEFRRRYSQPERRP
ncbi:MAG: hypothetical protein U1D55_04830 [Phycisphaerae bacterium]